MTRLLFISLAARSELSIEQEGEVVFTGFPAARQGDVLSLNRAWVSSGRTKNLTVSTFFCHFEFHRIKRSFLRFARLCPGTYFCTVWRCRHMHRPAIISIFAFSSWDHPVLFPASHVSFYFHQPSSSPLNFSWLKIGVKTQGVLDDADFVVPIFI